MSLYNMICGYSPACLFALPMLGHRNDYYPRFRDSWMRMAQDGTREIGIFTRVGSANRGCGYGEEKLLEDPEFIRFEDDDFDSTYGTYVFRCPAKWEADFDKLVGGHADEVSEEFRALLKDFWPTIGQKVVDSLRGNEKGDDHDNT